MVVIRPAFNFKEVFKNSIPQKPIMKQSRDLSKPLHLAFEGGAGIAPSEFTVFQMPLCVNMHRHDSFTTIMQMILKNITEKFEKLVCLPACPHNKQKNTHVHTQESVSIIIYIHC